MLRLYNECRNDKEQKVQTVIAVGQQWSCMSEPADSGAQLTRVNMLEWCAERNSQISVSVIILHITIAVTSIPGSGKNAF